MKQREHVGRWSEGFCPRCWWPECHTLPTVKVTVVGSVNTSNYSTLASCPEHLGVLKSRRARHPMVFEPVNFPLKQKT